MSGILGKKIWIWLLLEKYKKYKNIIKTSIFDHTFISE